MPSPAATIRQRVVIKVTHNLLAALALLAVGVAGVATQDKAAFAEQPAVTNSPTALMVANDCWTDEAPTGVIPGHVVVSVNGNPRLGGERLVGKALEQIFDGTDHGLRVWGFCR